MSSPGRRKEQSACFMATMVGVILMGIGATARAADCNANSVEDADDITAGTSQDCNTNGVPDECENGSARNQWARNVLGFSTEYNPSPDDWSAFQTTGAPNTDMYGDIETAYATANFNGTTEFITLDFEVAVYANAVLVRETYGNGFVTRIDIIDADGNPHTVWQSTDTSAPGAPVDFVAPFTQTTFLVKAVTIFIDTSHNMAEWEEIDAVQLQGVLPSLLDSCNAAPPAGEQTPTTTTTTPTGSTVDCGQTGNLCGMGMGTMLPFMLLGMRWPLRRRRLR